MTIQLITITFAWILLFVAAGLIFDYIKNVYQFEVLLEKLFRNFLRIEKTSLDFTRNFYNYLANEIRAVFFGKAAALFVIEEKHAKLVSLSSQDTSYLKHFKEGVQNGFELKSSLKPIKTSYNKFKKELNLALFRKKEKVLILPVFHQKKMQAFFVFIYTNRISYWRAMKRLVVNSRKLKEVILDLITVIRERDQNISMMTVGSIKDYAFITVDMNLLITSWNKGAEIMFGYDSDEIVNKKITDFIDPKSIVGFDKALEIAEKTEEVKTEIEMRDCNSTLIISEFVLKKILVNSVAAGYYFVIKDITKEEIWKINIKRQSMINKSIVENARDGIFLLNEEDKIIYMNEKVKKIIDAGTTYLGKEIYQVLPITYNEKVREKINELKNSEVELVFLNQKIGDLWYNIRFFPIKSTERFEGVIIFFIDNTYEMKTREKLEEMNKNLIDDLAAARLLQMSLIPSVLPDNKFIRFESIFIPSDEVGGDFYYVDEFDIGGKKYYLSTLADVSGHGVGASMLTVLVKDVYSDFKNMIEIEKNVHVSRFLRMLNKKIINLNIIGTKFVTVFLMLVEIETRKMHYCSAGHPHAMVLRVDEKCETFGIKNSPPVGIIDEYVYREDEKQLYPGDKICLYSDGILDLFGHEAIHFNQFLIEKRAMNIQEIKKEIEKHIETVKKEPAEEETEKHFRLDDITFVFMELGDETLWI